MARTRLQPDNRLRLAEQEALLGKVGVLVSGQIKTALDEFGRRVDGQIADVTRLASNSAERGRITWVGIFAAVGLLFTALSFVVAAAAGFIILQVNGAVDPVKKDVVHLADAETKDVGNTLARIEALRQMTEGSAGEREALRRAAEELHTQATISEKDRAALHAQVDAIDNRQRDAIGNTGKDLVDLRAEVRLLKDQARSRNPQLQRLFALLWRHAYNEELPPLIGDPSAP